ncbi:MULTISPECIES: YoaK family protein [Asticcacaulis]|uniref:YoaK family protein n=1 Tax=Asticcacaulis TaxID=76890 RepID=UPI001AE25319|nr:MULTISPECIES: YoaK family protein [Asticcacaulis]MBP2158618.1 uncharacterized membrane protein YoaK (UPF0700 family) [Asticcacaulis solisilvae]MDR6799664.1 uncharacterized membrane protein YoaK (UPF0700 family) [Asticcacaulis sp. BE141]
MHAHDRTSQGIAVGLALLAGYIDALGFLSLGGYFVSFMSGNSTRSAVDLIHGASWKVALIPLGIIALFVLGVMLGRAIRHYITRTPSTSVLVFMSAALCAATLAHEAGAGVLAVSLMAIAMGAANNIFVREGEVTIGVTYMTGALVKLGQRLAGYLLGEKDRAWQPYFFLWAGLVAGACLGAAAFTALNLRSLWGGALLCLVLTLTFWRRERSATQ